jgi:hypothetical protein
MWLPWGLEHRLTEFWVILNEIIYFLPLCTSFSSRYFLCLDKSQKSGLDFDAVPSKQKARVARKRWKGYIFSISSEFSSSYSCLKVLLHDLCIGL